MLRTSRLLAASILCAVCSAPVPSAAQWPETYAWEDMHYEHLYLEVKGASQYSNYTVADFAVARVQSDEIMSELATEESEWSGEFGVGMDLSFVRFRWAPSSGFVQVMVYTCRPSVRQLNYGSAVEREHSVDLVPVIGVNESWKPGSVWRLVKVRWGQERYLIPEDEVGEFCDYVAGLGAFNGDGALYSHGLFFRKHGDCPDPAYELPVLPPGYEHLVKRSIDVEIVGFGTPFRRKADDTYDDKWEDEVTPVTINAGRSTGVVPGMVLMLFDSARGENITVTKVGEHTSQGEIERTKYRRGAKLPDGDDGQDPVYDPIRTGWRASTSLHKYLANSETKREE